MIPSLNIGTPTSPGHFSDTAPALDQQRAKIAAMYAREPLYQLPAKPSVIGTSIEREIQDQLAVLFDKAKSFLAHCGPDIALIPAEGNLDPRQKFTLECMLDFTASVAPENFDGFMRHLRMRGTPDSVLSADVAGKFYEPLFKQFLEALIVNCQEATAEDLPRLKTTLLYLAHALIRPVDFISVQHRLAFLAAAMPTDIT
ncbi:hypothetical protein [Bordetella genomosp. 11]|uniref:Uncharacterized protein n=1 Tax=Bordetella genomosp. 11 TaxID=1416808 RepID=A0A261UDQ7_9BORD|nr:hypothetical protein [Bordetella genomosp. 11]OZI60034.1 hypothetical protein CAL28_11205 [Bordetella genomosp. 11]